MKIGSFQKIYLVIILIIISIAFIFGLLGKKSRLGYFQDIELKVEDTLNLNGFDIIRFYYKDYDFDNVNYPNFNLKSLRRTRIPYTWVEKILIYNTNIFNFTNSIEYYKKEFFYLKEVSNYVFTNTFFDTKTLKKIISNSIKNSLFYSDLNFFIEDNNIIYITSTNDINNYIYTNSEITNYLYSMKLGYYSKIFRNSDLYRVYIDTNKVVSEFDNILKVRMNGYGSPFGVIVSDKVISNKIDGILYTLKLKLHIIYLISFFVLLYLISYFICRNNIDIFKYRSTIYITLFLIVFILSIILNVFYIGLLLLSILFIYLLFNFFIYIKKLSNEEYLFIVFTVFIISILFLFNFELLEPGFFHYTDPTSSMLEGFLLKGNNSHPRIIGYLLGVLYNIFGYHSYYIFFINLFLWYFSLFIIIVSLYLKYKNKYVILLVFLTFLSEIFFALIWHVRDITATLFIFASYSIIFALILLDLKNINIKSYIYLLFFILLITGMLWRHNFIVTIYPIFIYIFIDFLSNLNIKSIKKYIINFSILMISVAIILLFIYKLFPIITKSDTSDNYSTTHLFLLQIVACAVPNNDDSLIPDEWYEKGKKFDNVIDIYNYDKLNADNLSAPWIENRPFRTHNLEGLEKVWIRYIFKYPLSYINHIINVVKNYIIRANFNFRLSVYSLEMDSSEYLKMFLNDTKLFENLIEKKVTLSPIESKIYSLLYKILPAIKYTVIFVFISFLLLFLSLFIIIKNKYYTNRLLLFTFSTSLSSVATICIVILFTPVITYRYIYPIILISIISLISFITFIFDNKKINKGN